MHRKLDPYILSIDSKITIKTPPCTSQIHRSAKDCVYMPTMLLIDSFYGIHTGM